MWKLLQINKNGKYFSNPRVLVVLDIELIAKNTIFISAFCLWRKKNFKCYKIPNIFLRSIQISSKQKVDIWHRKFKNCSSAKTAPHISHIKKIYFSKSMEKAPRIPIKRFAAIFPAVCKPKLNFIFLYFFFFLTEKKILLL